MSESDVDEAVSPDSPGQFLYEFSFSRDGESLGRPSLLVTEGEEASLSIANEQWSMCLSVGADRSITVEVVLESGSVRQVLSPGPFTTVVHGIQVSGTVKPVS